MAMIPLFQRIGSRRPATLIVASQKKAEREKGSISVLTFGLFFVTLSLLILITDIASIAIAKSSLVHATEAAAIRATHSLDLSAYYRGGSGAAVPIDCQAARIKVLEEFNLWMQSSGDMHRQELQQVWLTDFSCDGNIVQLTASARATLPFRLPQSSMSYVEIHTTISAKSDRQR